MTNSHNLPSPHRAVNLADRLMGLPMRPLPTCLWGRVFDLRSRATYDHRQSTYPRSSVRLSSGAGPVLPRTAPHLVGGRGAEGDDTLPMRRETHMALESDPRAEDLPLALYELAAIHTGTHGFPHQSRATISRPFAAHVTSASHLPAAPHGARRAPAGSLLESGTLPLPAPVFPSHSVSLPQRRNPHLPPASRRPAWCPQGACRITPGIRRPPLAGLRISLAQRFAPAAPESSSPAGVPAPRSAPPGALTAPRPRI